jgi:hypothetical protein
MYYPAYHVVHIEKFEQLLEGCNHPETVRKMARVSLNAHKAGTTFLHISDMDMTRLLNGR